MRLTPGGPLTASKAGVLVLRTQKGGFLSTR